MERDQWHKMGQGQPTILALSKNKQKLFLNKTFCCLHNNLKLNQKLQPSEANYVLLLFYQSKSN